VAKEAVLLAYILEVEVPVERRGRRLGNEEEPYGTGPVLGGGLVAPFAGQDRGVGGASRHTVAIASRTGSARRDPRRPLRRYRRNRERMPFLGGTDGCCELRTPSGRIRPEACPEPCPELPQIEQN
jgi:hypothetical protein